MTIKGTVYFFVLCVAVFKCFGGFVLRADRVPSACRLGFVFFCKVNGKEELLGVIVFCIALFCFVC